ncbi:alpha/beta hydrolase [Reichenbachiella ulvae]|uniref:Alpha/beta hydrolase n=1 Tax=Reichenbachiella ulvae TaxID=2980104 RepID=A0ABT3CPE4_9BACT|nr:alpha/beta hydrolase [Reichenbachiella ulvae]MCV9385399.1 alpha/beta hydrolase [Reichenbachiella ulvae]
MSKSSVKFEILLFTVGFLFLSELKAQDFPRDTSYTVASSYAKYLKSFPEITMARAIAGEVIKEQKDLVYRDLGSRQLHVDVFSPKKIKKRAPLVVMVHGGGWISGDKSHMEELAKTLAGRGYVAATVEYRLSPEIEYPAGVQDVKYAIRWLKCQSKKMKIDSSRVAVLGASAGGQLAALVAYSSGVEKFEVEGGPDASSRVQAAVDMDGVLAFNHPESEEGTVAAKWLGGTYEEIPEIWDEASALYHVSSDDPPTLFLNSSYLRFHAGQDDVIEKLNGYGIESEVHQLGDRTPHTFWLFDPWFEPTADYISDFLDGIFKE